MSNMSPLVICPFYQYDRGLQVVCEGGTNRLKDQAGKEFLLHSYCEHGENWKQCTMSRTLNAHYDKKAEEEELDKRKKYYRGAGFIKGL